MTQNSDLERTCLGEWTREEIDDLPGAEMVLQGLEDAACGRWTLEGLLIAIGSPRLREAGLPLPPPEALPKRPEHRLYELLEEKTDGRVHSQYNALIRRLVSFERALEGRRVRKKRQGSSLPPPSSGFEGVASSPAEITATQEDHHHPSKGS